MIVPESRREEWNQLVASCRHGDVLQCREWGELKARTGWEPLPLAVAREGRLAACCLLPKRPLPLGRCLLYAPRGPVVDFADEQLWEELANEIRKAARRHRAILVKVDPAVPADEITASSALEAAGFQPVTSAEAVGGVQPKYVMKVDLARSEEELLAAFAPKWRYNIRLAERKGVTVRSDCHREDVETFYELLKVTARRDGFTIRALSYFYDLWDLIITRGLGRMFLARYEGEVIACTLVFCLPPQAWYVYGASGDEHRNKMPNHALQWAMMRWAKEQGCTVFDMRGVAREVEGEPQGPLAGLNRFKRGFDAYYVEYLPDYELVGSRLGYWAFRTVLPWARAWGRRQRAQEEA